jgi:hypothetical protein
MKDILYCPRTGVPLTEVDIDGIHIEISTDCGGIFFDNFELQHFDEEHEPAGKSCWTSAVSIIAPNLIFHSELSARSIRWL